MPLNPTLPSPVVPATATIAGETVLGSSGRRRLDSVDLLRGLVMVIMALDHVRDWFTNVKFSPTDLTQASPVLFLTRWVTHFCAPSFVFLAGTAAYLSLSRGKSRKELSVFLLTRGLWLVVLELTLIQWVFRFNLDYNNSMSALVIWALGWSMVALSGLVFLPLPVIAGFGASLILFHNLFDTVRPESLGAWRWLWMVLHQPGILEPRPGVHFLVAYPLVPWIGVMAVGYAFGRVLILEPERRRSILRWLGTGVILAFLILRTWNHYGDARPWSTQSTGLLTALSFLNCSKYPPSLLFLLMTLGPAILFLSWADRPLNAAGRWLVTFGRVPFFYYVLHIFLIHVLVILFAAVKHGTVAFLFETSLTEFPANPPAGYGYGLPVVYLVWVALILMLTPACRWFANLKARRRDPWLSYL
jgi:uncharacterized membrane protein